MAALQARKSFGRTWCMLMTISNMSNMIDPFIIDSAESDGFKSQQLTFYKETVRKIFRYGKGATCVRVGNSPFTVTTIFGSTYIVGGVIDVIYLSSFPYMTQVAVHRSNGSVDIFNLVGNEKLK